MFVDGSSVNKNFFAKGDVIFSEGEPGDAAYIVESGAVGIYKTVEGERIELAVMKEGELFGELAIIDGSKRMAQAIAVDDAVVVTVPRAGLEAMLSKHEPFVQTLIKIMVDNLRNVHEIYMRRPRSVDDYFNAINFNLDCFQSYLDARPESDPKGEVARRLRLIAEQLSVMRDMCKDMPDNRESVLGDGGKESPG